MNWIQRFLTAIATHKADASAHHAKTTSFATLTDRWTLAQAYRGTVDHIMVFQGAGADPITEAKPTGATSSGTYVGNSVDDRQIPHGLGVSPKAVFISRPAADGPFHAIYDQDPDEIFWYHPDNTGSTTLGASMDATNFIIGDASSDDRTANANGQTYYWVAIG